jgi:hypothetical protein
MKMLTFTAAVAVAALFAGGPALAQAPKANCQPSASPRGDASGPKAKAPEKIEGTVTKVDPTQGMITVRNSSGTSHEFKGSTETLNQYHVGDKIEMTLRSEPC